MSSGVTPVFRHVVETAKHIWSSEACPVRTCRRLTRVIVLRGVSWSRRCLIVWYWALIVKLNHCEAEGDVGGGLHVGR